MHNTNMNRTVLPMHSILQELAKDWPIFHSEEHLQYELARKIKKTRNLHADIEIEFPFLFRDAKKKSGIDIVVSINKVKFPIELKYKTCKSTYEIDRDVLPFNLKLDPENYSRADFLKDIERIEYLSEKLPSFQSGFALFLTNNQKYWNDKPKKGDEAFNLSESIVVPEDGWLKWKENKDRKKKNVQLMKRFYEIKWEEYGKNGLFKYLLVEITK